MKKLLRIVNEINDMLVSEMCRNYMDEGYVSISLKYNNHIFEVSVDKRDNVEFIIINDKHYHRSYPNIENILSKYIVSWYEMEAIAEKHNDFYECDGFNDEADYIKYKYAI
jgi:hypothetical protein